MSSAVQHNTLYFGYERSDELVKWRSNKERKPILLGGARQVGKTHLLEHLFGEQHFKNVHKLDFLANPNLSVLFDESLESTVILKSTGMYERTKTIKQIHRNLIDGYLRDFGKYSGKVNAQHIESVFMNVPRLLSKNIDGSVKRFTFKEVIAKKQRYTELSSPINW